MRLLYTGEYDPASRSPWPVFKEFFDKDIPKYVILSHTRGSDEVTYQDLKLVAAQCDVAVPYYISGSKGYQKVRQCCQLARGDGFD